MRKFGLTQASAALGPGTAAVSRALMSAMASTRSRSRPAAPITFPAQLLMFARTVSRQCSLHLFPAREPGR
eukprot:3558027-Prymnesium_polylepis.1